MLMFLIIFCMAMLISSIGFKKYIWFISIGYGFSVAAIALTVLFVYLGTASAMTIAAAIILAVYGARLGCYLIYREIKSKTYNTKMKKEIKSGKDMKFGVKCCIWVSAAILYACQTCPLLFRAQKPYAPDDTVFIVGTSVSLLGFIIEYVADYQKSRAKRKNPGKFVDTGLYRIVRCPNYFGEVLIWTGIFIGGIMIYSGALEWIAAILGYLGIIYVMFSGARRLEERQNRTYGSDPEYQAYYKKTPILIPLIPLYSVVNWKWLVA